MRKTDDTTTLSRRQILKGGAALAGASAGTAITGFPAVIAAEPVKLRYLSTATNQSPAIAEKAAKDLGIKIEYVAVTTDDVTKRARRPTKFLRSGRHGVFQSAQPHPVRQPDGNGRQEDQARGQARTCDHKG